MSSFRIEGIEELQNELEGLIKAGKTTPALQKAVEPLHKSIHSSAPVLTGKLKGSLTKKVTAKRAYVSSTERYAFILEHGSSHTRKHMHYFSDAVADAEDAVLDILEEELFRGV